MHLGGKLEKTMAEGETIVKEIRRHPAGLIPIYAMSALVLVVFFWFVSVLINSEFVESLNINDFVWSALLIVLIVLTIVAIVLMRQIYWANELIITNENVVQILRRSLFSQDVAQVNLGKVQDVSVAQRGFWQFTWKYGTVIIETAGEVASYHFKYAPNPNEIASAIIQAHDDYIALHGQPKETFTGSP